MDCVALKAVAGASTCCKAWSRAGAAAGTVAARDVRARACTGTGTGTGTCGRVCARAGASVGVSVGVSAGAIAGASAGAGAVRAGDVCVGGVCVVAVACVSAGAGANAYSCKPSTQFGNGKQSCGSVSVRARLVWRGMVAAFAALVTFANGCARNRRAQQKQTSHTVVCCTGVKTHMNASCTVCQNKDLLDGRGSPYSKARIPHRAIFTHTPVLSTPAQPQQGAIVSASDQWLRTRSTHTHINFHGRCT